MNFIKLNAYYFVFYCIDVDPHDVCCMMDDVFMEMKIEQNIEFY